jgi:phosphate starvation-inducible protein PhoH
MSKNKNQNKKQKLEPKKDLSPKVPQNSKIKNELQISQRELNEKQKQFLDIAMNKETKMIFISGPAGTSKTFLAVLASLRLLNQRKMSDIIYLRSAVESS